MWDRERVEGGGERVGEIEGEGREREEEGREEGEERERIYDYIMVW